MKSAYDVIGAMAGSSMDGLDLTHVSFEKKTDNAWSFSLKDCETIPYPNDLYNSLQRANKSDLKSQKALDVDFGKWIGQEINQFLLPKDSVELVGIHGHTVIHKPEQGISWQLGDGATIANKIGINTITEFRTQDVKLGGQGAPLVPLGDFLLFNDYEACINLGGIANVSLKENQTAWDICPCNQVLNYYAQKLGKTFDKGGNLARVGQFDKSFYHEISDLDFFQLDPPKSLPNEFIGRKLLDTISPKDGLHTYTLFIVDQIGKSLSNRKVNKLLVTGGGAFNSFLIEKLKAKLTETEIVVPDPKLVAFKEAIVFAFLALKKSLGEVNVLSSVTGASKDSCSGVIHLPND